MTFTYAGTYNSDREKVRENIRDTVSGSGPLPADANFSDELIAGIIADEGTWQRAVAACFEMLASAWSRFPSYSTDGLRLDRSDIADAFVKTAKEWRGKYGGSARQYAPVYVAGQITKDGYSDDITNDDVDAAGEYGGHQFEYVTPGQ